MKKLFMLCAVGLWVGCGAGTQTDTGAEQVDLGTAKAAVCAGTCPQYTYNNGYHCDTSCYPYSCSTSYNANSCTAPVYPTLAAFDKCAIGCPQNLGYYAASYAAVTGCSGLVNPPSPLSPNSTHCAVVPDPATVSTYTQCGNQYTPCGTGYHQGGTTTVGDCYQPGVSGTNAVICVAN